MTSLDDIKSKIDKHIKKNPQFHIHYLKKKYVIIDGYFHYQLQLSPTLRCQCGQKLCDHVLFMLLNKLRLSYFSVTYLFALTPLYDIFIKHINDDQLNSMLEKETDKILNGESCGICLNSLTDKRYKYILDQCNICKKLAHYNCIAEWKKKTETCIYCGL